MSRNRVSADWIMLAVLVTVGAWFAVDFVSKLTLDLTGQVVEAIELDLE